MASIDDSLRWFQTSSNQRRMSCLFASDIVYLRERNQNIIEATDGSWQRSVNYPQSLFGYSLLAMGYSMSFHPPAMAPRISSGSFPAATASGSSASGDASDQSSAQAKKRRNARRWPVP